MNKSTLPISILFALTLSACATAPKEEVEPVTVPEPVVEQPAVPEPVVEPEIVAEPTPEPQATMQEEAPKPVVKKKKRRVAKAAPKPVEVAPVVEPEPVPAPVPVAAPVEEPPVPAIVERPVTRVKEEGFLEKYWIWLLGIVIAGAATMLLFRKKG